MRLKLWDGKHHILRYTNKSLQYIEDKVGGIYSKEKEEVSEVEKVFHKVQAGLLHERYFSIRDPNIKYMDYRFNNIKAFTEYYTETDRVEYIDEDNPDFTSLMYIIGVSLLEATAANNKNIKGLSKETKLTPEQQLEKEKADKLAEEDRLYKLSIEGQFLKQSGTDISVEQLEAARNGVFCLQDFYFQLLSEGIPVGHEEYWYEWDMNDIINFITFNSKRAQAKKDK